MKVKIALIITTLFVPTHTEIYNILIFPYFIVSDRQGTTVRQNAEFFLTRYKNLWTACETHVSGQKQRLHKLMSYNPLTKRFELSQEGFSTLALVMQGISSRIAKQFNNRMFSSDKLFEHTSPQESTSFFYKKLVDALTDNNLPFRIDAYNDRLFLFVNLGTTTEPVIQHYLSNELQTLKIEKCLWITVPYHILRYPKKNEPDIKLITYGLDHELEQYWNFAKKYKKLAQKKAIANTNVTPPSPQH